MISKKVFVPIALLLLGGGAVFGMSQVSAASNNTPMSGLAAVIASKFGIDQVKVEETITQFHNDQMSKMQQDHKKMQEERLTKLVSDGKITEAQKQLILTKLKELQANRESMKDKTPEERKSQMEAEKKSLEDWAKQNNIDIRYLRGGFGKGHMMK